MTSSICIPSLRQILSGQENFSVWRRQASNMLKIHGLITIVEGTEKKPTAVTTTTASTGEETSSTSSNTTTEWEQRDALASVFLEQNIESNISTQIPDFNTSAELWSYLLDRFDHKTTGSLHHLLKSLVTFQYSPEKSLQEHLDEFETLWTLLASRTKQCTDEKTDPFGYYMHKMASVTEVKAAFLLITLAHESLENVIDNLDTKEGLSYEDVRQKLADIATKRRLAEPTSAFLVTNEKTCTYCARRGKPAGSHTVEECRHKAADKEKRKNKTNNGNAHFVGGLFNASFMDQIFDNNERTANISGKNHITNIDGSTLATHGTSEKNWIFDTGATHHMTGHHDGEITPCTGMIAAASNEKLQVTGYATITFEGTLPNKKPTFITLSQVLIVPELGNLSLVSWKIMAAKGHVMQGTDKDVLIIQKQGMEPVAHALLNEKGQYVIQTPTNGKALVVSAMGWHQHLGHAAHSTVHHLREMISDPECLLKSLKIHTVCTICMLTKSTKLPMPAKPQSRTSFLLELVHTDLSGKFSTPSLGGFNYYISFIDDFSRMTFVYFLRNKNDATAAFLQWSKMVENLTEKTIKRIRMDNGGEYKGPYLHNLQQKGISAEFTVPYSHESNGVAERFNRTIGNMARGATEGIGKHLWAEAIQAMTYVIPMAIVVQLV